jgi:hypothetical protein
MRKIWSFCVILVCLPLIAAAQDYPKAEIFTGYSYLRGTDLNANFNGFDVSGSIPINRWFGVTADFSAYVNSWSPNIYSVLFGPKFTHRGQGRLDPYFQVLLGAVGFGGITWEPNPVFAYGAGAGLDLKLHKRVAARLVDFTYLQLRQQFANSSNGRLSSGLVWRFGGEGPK